MLPSTFQDRLKEEEQMKRQLKVRLEVARFLQDTMEETAKRVTSQSKSREEKASAKELLDLITRVKSGDFLPNEDIVRCAKMFKDELTIDNMSRPQLTSLCRFLGLQTFGTDSFLRFQVRNKIRQIKEDDKMIMWEGGGNQLTLEETKQACQERGMRSIGLTEQAYRRQLKKWLELSVNQQVPASLLILSRAFIIQRPVKPEIAIQVALSMKHFLFFPFFLFHFHFHFLFLFLFHFTLSSFSL